MKETNNNENKKKFNLFDWYYNRGKDNGEPDEKILKNPSLKNYFVLMWKKFGKLISCNLLLIFTNFPIAFIIIAMSGILGKNAYSPLYQVWGPLSGVMLFDNNYETSVYAGIYGTHTRISVINTQTTVFFCLGILLIFTIGISKVGTTYLYRNMLQGEPVFPFTDFIYIIKKNWKQALIFGIIDSIFIGIFSYNIYFLLGNYASGGLTPLMFFLSVALCLYYSIMRNYCYTMIFTFDLSIFKIIKNSLYLVILGAKRNLMFLLGAFLIILINFLIYNIFIPIGIILPFIISLALIDFTGVYTSFPIILKYMVEEE